MGKYKEYGSLNIIRGKRTKLIDLLIAYPISNMNISRMVENISYSEISHRI